MTPERTAELETVVMTVCRPCLAGEGEECHTPGCALWLHRVDLPIHADEYLGAERDALRAEVERLTQALALAHEDGDVCDPCRASDHEDCVAASTDVCRCFDLDHDPEAAADEATAGRTGTERCGCAAEQFVIGDPHTEADHDGDGGFVRYGRTDEACGGCWGCIAAQASYYASKGCDDASPGSWGDRVEGLLLELEDDGDEPIPEEATTYERLEIWQNRARLAAGAMLRMLDTQRAASPGPLDGPLDELLARADYAATRGWVRDHGRWTDLVADLAAELRSQITKLSAAHGEIEHLRQAVVEARAEIEEWKLRLIEQQTLGSTWPRSDASEKPSWLRPVPGVELPALAPSRIRRSADGWANMRATPGGSW